MLIRNALIARYLQSIGVSNSAILVLLGFVRTINVVILIPVVAICVAFIGGITDSGFAYDMFTFLTEKLEGLRAVTYTCAKTLPDMVAYVECFR